MSRHYADQLTGERPQRYGLDSPDAVTEDDFARFCALKNRVAGHVIDDYTLPACQGRTAGPLVVRNRSEKIKECGAEAELRNDVKIVRLKVQYLHVAHIRSSHLDSAGQFARQVEL